VDLLVETAAWLTNPVHWAGVNGIPHRLTEHVEVSAISMAIALLLVLPLGLWIGHTRRAVGLARGLANLGRAVPTLAAIGIVLPLTAAIDPQLGFKVYPTIIAMVLLAAPPILVNAYTGVSSVDADLVEAARGMGMSEGQLLRQVEIPIAVPAILAGVRSATVQVVATATLGAIFGFGGLGRYLVDGIAQFDSGQIFGGVALVAALALAAEGAVALLQRRVSWTRRAGRDRAAPI
jgi:osmoprotectant transport system permease protein